MAGCGKLDNAGKVVTGSKLVCGTNLTYGVGKGVPKRTVVHYCAECQAKEAMK
jgi:hypothetical protein